MTDGSALAWLDSLPGVRADEPLAPHTTYNIGGPAERYVEISDVQSLAQVVAGCAARGVPLFALGNGSNILVADAGIEGLVVRGTDSAIVVEGDSIRASAGARMVKVAQAAERAGLAGLEWALGIPGTVGGSVHNNAGCFGSDMDATVARVNGLERDGAAAHWTHGACAFRYRGSAFVDGPLAGSLVSSAEFHLKPSGRAAIRLRMEEVQQARKETQPVTGRSTGSVFKNPPGDFAARLIEAAGLKGERAGGAMVSPQHSNYIVNADHATAADVAELVGYAREVVLEKTGVLLDLEMEPVGRWPAGAFG